MPQNTTLTHELSLATTIFEINVLELVKIAMSPKFNKNARGYHIFGFCAPDYYSV